jgi:hypothetical protein
MTLEVAERERDRYRYALLDILEEVEHPIGSVKPGHIAELARRALGWPPRVSAEVAPDLHARVELIGELRAFEQVGAVGGLIVAEHDLSAAVLECTGSGPELEWRSARALVELRPG